MGRAVGVPRADWRHEAADRSVLRALDAFVESTQKEVTGTVTLSLYKGNVSIVGRQSEHSLYRTDLSSFTMGESYDQKDAAGFIRILGLPARSQALLKSKEPVAK